MPNIREAAVSGSFYPDNPSALKRDIEKFINNATIEPVAGDITGIISPHAGYMYSGPVAAYGFKAVSKSRYDTVVIIAPSHRAYFQGVSVMDRGAYRTPLGLVDIDEAIAGAVMEKSPMITDNIDVHKREHSLEVQLPFLQYVLKDFRIVPLIMGSQDLAVCRILSESLYEVIKNNDKRFLIVGSTDLSHYYPYKEAITLDGVAVKHIGDFDIEGSVRDLERGRYEACGAGPMITTMMLSKQLGATEARVLKYANSGDVSGDKSGVVGYVSGIFYKHPKEGFDN